MGDKVTWWRRRWARNTAIALCGALALFTVVGFFVVPPIARSIAETQAGKQLGRRVSIGKIRLNPFSLSLTVERFQIYEADGTTPFVGFGKLYVNVQLASVYRLAPVVKEIRLESPRVRVVRIKESSDGFADLSAYNFSDILAKLNAEAAAAPPPKKDEGPAETPRFSINNVHLLDGQITFDDQPTAGHHVISDLRIGVPFISTLPVDVDTFVVPGLAVRIDGTPFSIDGRTKPFKDSLETTLDLRLNALDLAKYQSYVPVPLKFQLDSGALTAALDLSFVRPNGGEPAVTVTGQVELAKVAVRHRGKGADAAAPGGEPAVRLENLQVRLAKLDLSRMQFHVAVVRLAGLDVRATRLANGSIDLERWAPASSEPKARGQKSHQNSDKGAGETKPPTAAKKKEAGPRFVIDDIKLDGINVRLRDETVRPAFQLAVRDIDVAVKHLSNNPGIQGTMTVGLRAEPGGTLAQKGTVTLEPLSLAGEVKLDGIEPGRFAPYYADQIAFDINKGRVAVGAGYVVASKGRQTSITLHDAFVELAEFRLRRRGVNEDFLQLGALAVRKVDVDVDAQKVAVGQVESHDVRVRAARDEKGVIDVTTLAVGPAAKTPAPPGAKTPAAPAAAPPAAEPSSASAPAWVVDVARIDLDGWAARFDDRMMKPRAALAVDGLSLHARDLSTKPGSRISFDLKLGLNKTGKVALAGSAVAEPLAADVQLDLKKIEILPFQPYFRDQANLLITDGALSVKGRAKVETPRHAPVKVGAPAPAPRVTFAGDVDIGEFAALDGRKNERLLAWKSFHVGGIDVVSEPLALAIKQVALTDFKARLIIFPDAHFNLQDIAVADPAGPPAPKKPTPAPAPAKKQAGAPAPAEPAPKITIGEVTLQGGDVLFTDRLIQPNYSTEMTELAGRITGLSAEANTTAEVALRGAIDHSGVLTIDGRVNPLAKDLFVDLKVDLKEFELPPTSPYAGRYAGYGIDKGKLAISLDYHVANGKLDAKNRLTLDQFTFGEKVNSPDAVKLPVKLAVALLKDRHGVIDIDLPISGSLDDPQFKLGRLILKTLGNLIVKAVTAPFSLIAKAFGGGDEQSFVEFSPGGARLEGKALDKVKAVARALRERPGLSFEIEGQVDPQKDSPGLRQELYERKLRGQKIKAIVEAGGTAPANETVQLPAAERPQLVEAVYRAETFPKPRKPDGGEKTLPPPEMEKLILANVRVQPDDLRQLALRRANAVKEALAKAAPDAAARVFLVSPRTTSPGNRVDLKLKQD